MNIQDLLSRYCLNSRTALYNRLKVLGMELAKDNNDKSFATLEQLIELDELHKHIKAGNKMSNFVKRHKVVLDNTEQLREQTHVQSGHINEQSIVNQADAEIILESLAGAITNTINSTKNPLEKYRALQECEDKKWLLTTKDVEEIVGQKPQNIKGENYCIIGGWKFSVKGKPENQTLWSVEQLKPCFGCLYQ